MASHLGQRVVVAALAIPVAVALIWIGGWPLALALAALGVLGTREIYELARRQGIAALEEAGWVAAAGIPLLAYWAKGSDTRWAEPALYVGALWLLITLVDAMVRRGPGGRPLTAVSVTLFGCVYASGLLTFLIAIRHGVNAANRPSAYVALALFPLVITWIADTCAMAAGVRMGGPKLAPVLSPNKTQSGAAGGFAGAVVASVLLGLLVLNRVGWNFAVWQLLTLGAIVGIVAQVGDVAESLFKREAGVKDSSGLIPGHGGVLDRLDSLYFVIPTAAGLYRMFGVI
ncbi:MAG: phosphatidate cytidylyltransferase [Gemmatimonadales bacterium]|nr:phosphatidate cytidylyltransferase [Gemmatimonadales bacterium]